MMVHPTTIDPRLAGEVKRFHTWTSLFPGTVASHSWQMIRLLLALWPEAPRHLLVEVAFHDIGERVSGDIPYPGKSLEPGLREALDRVEAGARLSMALPWGVPPPAQLTAEEHAVLKLVDYLDMLEHALHELSLGNSHMQLVYQRCWKAIEAAAQGVPRHVQDKLDWYMAKRYKAQAQLLEDHYEGEKKQEAAPAQDRDEGAAAGEAQEAAEPAPEIG